MTSWPARCQEFLRLARRHAAHPERFSPADRRRIVRMTAAMLYAPDPWLFIRAVGVLIRLAEVNQGREESAGLQWSAGRSGPGIEKGPSDAPRGGCG